LNSKTEGFVGRHGKTDRDLKDLRRKGVKDLSEVVNEGHEERLERFAPIPPSDSVLFRVPAPTEPPLSDCVTFSPPPFKLSEATVSSPVC
jgi:hypothetical protein